MGVTAVLFEAPLVVGVAAVVVAILVVLLVLEPIKVVRRVSLWAEWARRQLVVAPDERVDKG